MTLICMVGGQLLARSTGDKTTDKVELGGQCKPNISYVVKPPSGIDLWLLLEVWVGLASLPSPV